MFTWLVNLFRKPDARGLFRFHDGRRWRNVDPIPVWYSLLYSQTFAFEKHIPLLQIDTERLAAAVITAAAVREAFGIPSVERGGLNTLQCVQLLTALLEWMELQKKSTSPTLTSPPLTASGFSDDGSPAGSGSDSGSTGSAPSSVSVVGPSTPCGSC